MAAYEVLLLNTAIPQIQAAQSGDTYVVPRDIAFSAALTLSAGTANGVPYLNGSKVVTTGSVLTFNGSTQLGIISASNAAYYAQAASGSSARINLTQAGVSSYIISTGPSDALMFIRDTTQAMTLDASGNLGVGATNPAALLDVSSGGVTSYASPAARFLRNHGTQSYSNLDGLQIYWNTSNGSGESELVYGNLSTSYLRFIHNNAGTFTERARITSGGYFKAQATSTYNDASGEYHEFVTSSSNNSVIRVKSNASSGTQYGVSIVTANDQNDTTRWFLSCTGGSTERATIRSDGGLANYSANNVNLASDERLKKDISPLATTWDKLKQIEVVNFRYKDCNEGDPLLYGVIAQQVQSIVPELVVATREAQEAVEAKAAVLNEKGEVVEPAVEAKEATPEYYGIREQPMYWLAIKALQEAMARIEQLEAKVAAMGA